MHRIQLTNVSKRFSKQAGAKIVSNWGFWNPNFSGDQWFWALKEINLTLDKTPERISIVGTNGSGKSTLLKIIAGITNPTSGSVSVRGKVVPILELFSGMQIELTGRENIYINGMILGMRRYEIQEKFDSIVDFAGIEKFVDMQLKHYSSGMMMRLGFSIATHVEAKIILVDEAWSVGDATFQAKSIKRLLDLNQQGAHLILVSHDLGILQQLTNKTLWLDQGEAKTFGPSQSVLRRYSETTPKEKTRA